MGKTETPAPPWKQLGFTKIIFNEPEILKSSLPLSWVRTSGKIGAQFSRSTEGH